MTILPLLAAALLTRADAGSPADAAFVRMPKVVFTIVRVADKTVIRCAAGQSAAACDDFKDAPIAVGERVWHGLARPAARVLRRRDETSEGASFLFEPLAVESVGRWTIELFDARSASPGLRPLAEIWPEGAAKPALLERLKYGVTTDIVGYEKKDGRVTRVFTSVLGFQQAARAFDPAQMVLN
jgi:hypothetical protein